VSAAGGPVFRAAMIHATLIGLEKDEPVRRRSISWCRPVAECADSNDLRSCWSRLVTGSSASRGRIMHLDPSLLLGDQALHELGPFRFVDLPRETRME
jgi:hypothetical protein